MSTRNIFTLIIISLFLMQCANSESEMQQRAIQAEFIKQIQEFCGHAYRGETQFISLGDGDHVLQDPEMIMVLNECSDSEIRIPFYVDDDRSRTWIYSLSDDGLHLAHDHRNPDGTEQEDNMYGGWADNFGDETVQFFPADESTIKDRPARVANKWSAKILPDEMEYIYSLYLNDELRFRAVFDLSQPHPTDI